ncbi:MAG: DUF885 domain-containing protein [Acidobacteriia bacterium]|nr:DUF885 domain-containing protein [Terriglobia bacterium]
MMRILLILVLVIAGGLLALPRAVMAQARSAADAPQEAARKFRVYLEDDWKRWMAEAPEIATEVGFPGQNRRWTDDSPEGIARRKRLLDDSLARLQAISRTALPESERLNYDLYRQLLEAAEEGQQYGDDPMPFQSVAQCNLWMPVNQMESIGARAASTLALTPHQTVADYEDILARLEALPRAVEQTQALLQEGLKRGYTPPRVPLRDLPKQVADLVPADPLASALLAPFTQFPAGFPEPERARLTERAKTVYTSGVAPAFRKLHDYLAETYLPACRESIAATALPDGQAAYAFRVRWQTTTNLTPQQIHAIGLAEVQRIRAEMDQVIAASGFRGSFHDFTEFLRTDPRFFYDKPEDLVNGYRIIAKKIDPQLAPLFGKLPRLPYGVTPIPAFKAPSQTTAYYQPGAPQAGRAGQFFVNTYKLEARPKWEMEALSMHESVPGHHLQIALAQELENVPEFRRYIGYSAFVEGWGLYSESLGEEMGFYSDPYSQFGQLAYEMWRAVRLVVDTGMHSMGWSRQQAIDYFRDHTGKTDQDVTVEVDRYIVWPGQALAYKLGQLKIRELRHEAETKLGAKFDIRKFHDAVLENGAVPLNVLEAHMKQWMDKQATH